MNISSSSLRRYCLLLEDNDYHISKDGRGHRTFFVDDLVVLKKFLVFKKYPTLSLMQAAIFAIMWNKADKKFMNGLQKELKQKIFHSQKEKFETIEEVTSKEKRWWKIF